MKIHNNERAYECQSCGQKFKQRGHLLRHELIHKRTDYKCIQCGAVFQMDFELRKHLESAHGVVFK
ncbi:C2H2 type domain-containing protein [Hexamita inflata]|nr:C2H2 type domain-containing protein [Hexamita inflata]CAI9966346.1 C2H2 type domain-containing protein [Hexamita inflata]